MAKNRLEWVSMLLKRACELGGLYREGGRKDRGGGGAKR